jgi:hypothetical protein
MKRIGDRIALLFKLRRQGLTAGMRYRGIVICGVSALSVMIAISYNGISSPSAPVQPGNIMSAEDSAQASELSGTSNTGWPYFDTFAEPFWSLSLASSVTLAGREASVREAISAKRSPANNSEDQEVIEPHAGKTGYWKRTIASDKSFLAGDRESEKRRIRDKDEVKKSGKSSAKKQQRRVTRKDRDREFDPLREIQRARETITRVIRRIL